MEEEVLPKSLIMLALLTVQMTMPASTQDEICDLIIKLGGGGDLVLRAPPDQPAQIPIPV